MSESDDSAINRLAVEKKVAELGTLAMLIAFIRLGKYLEARVRGKGGRASRTVQACPCYRHISRSTPAQGPDNEMPPDGGRQCMSDR